MAIYGEVLDVLHLTSRMVCVVLSGDGLAQFTPTPWTDQYVNALFLPEGALYEVPFDVDDARTLPAIAASLESVIPTQQAQPVLIVDDTDEQWRAVKAEWIPESERDLEIT